MIINFHGLTKELLIPMEKTTRKTKPTAAPKAPKAASAGKPKREPKASSAPLGHGVGRRKSAVARVWLRRGSGAIVINGSDFQEYFDTEVARLAASAPSRILPVCSNYDVEANVVGGGLSGQADAVKLGIARALLAIDETVRPLLRQHGLLTVDSRLKERKKYGQKGARRKFQFVKR